MSLPGPAVLGPAEGLGAQLQERALALQARRMGGTRAADPAGAEASASGKTSEAAKEFEGLLMSMVFQTMRKTIQPSGLLGGDSQSRKTYEYLMDQAVVKHAMEQGRGWGLAERLEADWNRSQERSTPR